MTRKKKNTSSVTASPELTHLQQELEWAEARCDRMGAQIERRERKSGQGRWYDEERTPTPEAVRRLKQRETRLRKKLDARVFGDWTPPLDHMVAHFGLSDLERTVLLLAAGCALSQSFSERLGRVVEHRGHGLEVESLFNFAELQLSERVDARSIFRVGAPLVINDLVQVHVGGRYSSPADLLTASISLTSRALQLILGSSALAEEYGEFSSLEVPRATMADVVLPQADKRRILAVLEHHDAYLEVRQRWGLDEVIRYGLGILLLFTGAPGTGKTLTAHAVADLLGKRVLNVDIPTFVGHSDAARFLPGLFREARLHEAVLFFDECESLFESRRRGNQLMTLLLTELERFEGVAVFATNLPQQLDEAFDRRILVRVDFPRPDAAAREEIWLRHLPPTAELADDVDLTHLARRFELNGGYIKNAVLNAVASAVHEGGSAPVLRQDHLERAAREQLRRPESDPLGSTSVKEPRARLDRVHLPPTQTRQVAEIVAAARVRRTVFERWGVAGHQSGCRGIVALFTGKPGTGKTLCAEAIAHELNRGLMRVLLPTTLSKWVGEAERRLERAFEEAEEHDAVLLLDEVDSLLMTRGAGRASRHDDALVNTLLDLLERHEGVAILATNRPEVLDPALRRRVGWTVEFPFAGPRVREAIWRAHVPPSATAGVPLDFSGLANRYPLTGARIRNAAVRAAVRAATSSRPLDLALLEEAAAEEVGEPPQRTLVMAEVADA